jgi:hypothetical protein
LRDTEPATGMMIPINTAITDNTSRSSKTVKPLEVLGTLEPDDVFKRVCRDMISNQRVGTGKEYGFD